ncbi:MAG: leucine-rich repeat domain-containing protein [Clostridiales bacterium]|nr:leucine-rich repeat domain-containing protein [Clostridiales bacterium]
MEKNRLLAFPAAFTDEEFTIPSTVETVAPYAFENNKNLTSVTVPPSVKTIENNAFDSCSELETLYLNEGLESIGEYAFSYCGMLDLNTLPNSVTHIGNCAFNDTAAYDKEENWENDLFYIGNCLLDSRQHTESEPIAVKDGTRLIADYAFSYCFKNVTEIMFPDTVTHIGEMAMLSCDSLEKVRVLEQNTSFKSVDGVLYNDDVSVLIQYPQKKAEKTFVIPDTVTVIGEYALSS